MAQELEQITFVRRFMPCLSEVTQSKEPISIDRGKVASPKFVQTM